MVKRISKSSTRMPVFKGPVEKSMEIGQLVIKDEDKVWLKNYFIGQISAMYVHSFVQQILQSEGFEVKVSSWSGVYSIIQFEVVEQLEIFWDLKESMLKDWFCDIDSVENFMNEKKLRVWACIEGLPLEVWNESSLVTIASQWGNVIRLDTDTAERNRLDIAKILLGVKGLSSIPPFLSIEVNGVSHFLRVSITEFEDDTCWINGMFEHLVI
ncbi:hypothetical protein V6N13_064664 [Hibiscus sabdariffa]